MQNLNYYVLGTKNSPLLKEYLEKYYNKLLNDLETIKFLPFPKVVPEGGGIQKSIQDLLKIDNKKFILNPDISSLINSIITNLPFPKGVLEEGGIRKSITQLENEINIFLSEGINSLNLNQNKGKKIGGTNIRLTSNDNNPYNGRDAHPDHREQGAIAGSWGEKTEEEWLNIYEKSFNLLKQLDDGIYDELNEIITKIVPLGTAKGMHNSASYKECIGHLYMGYTIDSSSPEINNLEAIIHESSHNKLNLIMQFDPIVLNDKELKYYSAIRPDARHIHGVFLGLHAFAPTMYILMKAYNEGHLGDDKMWLEKIVLYYMKTKFLQKVIKKYGILTHLGKDILEEIDSIIFKMDLLLKEIKPSKEIIMGAKINQVKHFNEVNSSYVLLKY